MKQSKEDYKKVIWKLLSLTPETRLSNEERKYLYSQLVQIISKAIDSAVKDERERVIGEIENFEGTGVVKSEDNYISCRELRRFLKTLKER